MPRRITNENISTRIPRTSVNNRLKFICWSNLGSNNIFLLVCYGGWCFKNRLWHWCVAVNKIQCNQRWCPKWKMNSYYSIFRQNLVLNKEFIFWRERLLEIKTKWKKSQVRKKYLQWSSLLTGVIHSRLESRNKPQGIHFPGNLFPNGC